MYSYQRDRDKPLTMQDCTECYARPGAESILDVIHPVTGLTWCYGHTEAEVQARDPGVARMLFTGWLRAKAERQHKPIHWEPTSEQQYHEMLEVLPPAAWYGGYFLVGEPTDHDAGTGAPRFQAYRQIGSTYQASSRPITHKELKSIVYSGS